MSYSVCENNPMSPGAIFELKIHLNAFVAVASHWGDYSAPRTPELVSEAASRQGGEGEGMNGKVMASRKEKEGEGDGSVPHFFCAI